MSRWNPQRGRMSMRRKLELNDAAQRYYAASAGVEVQEHLLNNLPPKRERVTKPRIGPSEHQLQSAVIQWWRHACICYELPEFALFAIPNGGARDAITGSRLKAEGVRPGIPDLMLAASRREHHGLYIENKVATSGGPSAAQKEVLRYLLGAGYSTSVCYSSGDAIDRIKAYLAEDAPGILP